MPVESTDEERCFAHPESPKARWVRIRRGTGLSRVPAAIRFRVRAIFHALRWKPRFAAFGWRSTLASPALLINTGKMAVGRNVTIRPGARMEVIHTDQTYEPALEIGDGTSIHLHLHVGAALRIRIGRNVLIAGNVYITDHDHALPDPREEGRAMSDSLLAAETSIGDDCWLGEGAMILKGVRLGRGCVVGAHSVVTRSFPDYSMLVGSPARRIRRYSESEERWVPASSRREPASPG